MAETPSILNNAEAARQPAAGAYKLLYTATETDVLTVDICAGDAVVGTAHVSVWVVPASVGYVDGAPPPAYSQILSREPLEATATEGAHFHVPAFSVGPGDCVVVRTDTVGCNFFCHGFRFS